jgi:hypothetical protein
LSSVPYGPVTPANIVNNNCFDSGVFPQCAGEANKPLFDFGLHFNILGLTFAPHLRKEYLLIVCITRFKEKKRSIAQLKTPG